MFFLIEKIRQFISPEFLKDGNGSRNTEQAKAPEPELDTMAEALQEIEQNNLVYEWQERSAILEYDGGLSREDADRRAAFEVLNRVNQKQ